jgi:hypothetical protein
LYCSSRNEGRDAKQAFEVEEYFAAQRGVKASSRIRLCAERIEEQVDK